MKRFAMFFLIWSINLTNGNAQSDIVSNPELAVTFVLACDDGQYGACEIAREHLIAVMQYMDGPSQQAFLQYVQFRRNQWQQGKAQQAVPNDNCGGDSNYWADRAGRAAADIHNFRTQTSEQDNAFTFGTGYD